MNKLLKEFLLWIFIAVPYIYLATVWNQLPERVPTHFDFHGNPDAWSDKATLWYIPGGILIFCYFLLLVVPYLDPKKKIQLMGNKYYRVRFGLMLFFSLISFFIIYSAKAGKFDNPEILFVLIGGLFAVLGNYFPAMRPNYFVGIRVPWTLESEHVWKKTHRMAGPIWMTGGLMMIIISLLVNNMTAVSITSAIILAILVVVPVVYSYISFQKEKRMLNNGSM
jgi:uncharacterized membrane protein